MVRLLTLLLTLTLTSCKVGPNYHPPCIETPCQWRTTVENTSQYCNTSWWEEFNDPVLIELIDIALHENKDLYIATARVDEFLGRYRVTRSELFPQIYSDFIPGRERTSNLLIPPTLGIRNPDDIYQALLRGSWEIDLWGRIRRASEAASAELFASENTRQAVVSTIVTGVALAYIDLLRLDRQLQITIETTETRLKTLELFSSRYEAGVISKIDLSQIESEYQLALARIPLFQKLISQQENLISILLGRNPQSIPRGSTIETIAMPCIPNALPSELLYRRPEIREAEQLLIASNARIGVARAAYFPAIRLTGEYGSASRELSNLFTGPSQAWNYFAPITTPIFTAGLISGEVAAAYAVREQALGNYERQIQQAFADVEDSLIGYVKDSEEAKARDDQVKALKVYAELAQLRYDEGYASYLEVLDAQRSLFNAELSYTDTYSNQFQSVISLYKALGGGWICEADPL